MAKMVEGCCTPDEMAKINKVSCRGSVAILKETNIVDMTEVLKSSRQFDMDRGLTKEEMLSKSQRAAARRVQYANLTHGCVAHCLCLEVPSLIDFVGQIVSEQGVSMTGSVYL